MPAIDAAGGSVANSTGRTAVSEVVDQHHLWDDGEFETMLAKDSDGLKKYPEMPILTRAHTLNVKPPFFSGALPLSYQSEDAANGSIPLRETSPLGHLIRYVYGNLDTANYVLPAGARATEPSSGRLLAEARLSEPHMGSMTPYEITEIHYNSAGSVVFRSRSSFSKEFGHFKISESDISGKKEQEFFLWWPTGQ
jgi:hypothetical protein